MLWGDRNPENGDDDSVWVQIDCERVKEGVSGRRWDVVFAVVERHITELAVGEVDENSGAGAQWPKRCQGDVRGRGRGIYGEDGRVTAVGDHGAGWGVGPDCQPSENMRWMIASKTRPAKAELSGTSWKSPKAFVPAASIRQLPS